MDDEILCKLHGIALYINFGITTYSITAIAINRWVYHICVVINEIKKNFLLINNLDTLL